MGDYIENSYKIFIKEGLLEIKGLLSPVDVDKEISSAKAVIVPSTVDNLPYTVIECMARKKIVLASNQGGHRELIEDSINGFLFDHNDFNSFQDKLRYIFNLNESETKEITENAAATIVSKCNPQVYYENKLRTIAAYTPTLNNSNIFKFTRDIANVTYQEKELDDVNSNLLSIIIPFYNMGKYITDTVNSILSSYYKDIEIIIVDDGSDDEYSRNILKSLISNKNITVFSQNNAGLAEARNAGAHLAKGKFIAFLDADDLVHPTFYSRAISILSEKANVHFVGCWVQYFEGSNAIWPSFNPEPPYLLYHNMINSSGLVYKKNSFLSAGLNDKIFLYGMEDYDSVIGMVKKGFRGVVIPETLFKYRVRKDSMARGFNQENQSYLYQLIARKHQDFFSAYATEITSLLNANGPGYIVDNPTLDYHLYNGKFLKNKVIRKLMTFIKHHPQLRKKAIYIYKKINA